MILRQKRWALLILLGLALTLSGCNGCERRPGAPPAPIAPSNLSATAVSRTQIDLAWLDNSGDEEGFYVYRRTDTYTKIAILNANVTSYSNIGLNPGTTYYYQISAYNEGGESNLSNEVGVTTPPAGKPPIAPSNLMATVGSCYYINLVWQDNSDNEDGFKIFRTFGGTDYYKIADLNSNTTSYSDSVSPSSSYWYYVSAYNSFGSASSNSVQSPMTPPTVEILSYRLDEFYYESPWSEWRTYILGDVRNNNCSPSEPLTVWIAGKFYNHSDIVVDIRYVVLYDVAAGETWRFEISYWGERIKRVEVWVDDYYN